MKMSSQVNPPVRLRSVDIGKKRFHQNSEAVPSHVIEWGAICRSNIFMARKEVANANEKDPPQI
jgi:hypothetical protein